jgi:predicted Holliday junction resolvase-like endonuclease
MREKDKAKKIIRTLNDRGFYAECPCCEEPVRLSNCGLFYLDHFTPEAKGIYDALQAELRTRATQLKKHRKQITETSEVGAKAVNIGFILERLAPSMSAFRFHRNDCRSLFDPIDYLIFEGLSKTGAVSRIFFADIKTGGSSLKPHQKEIRSLVESKKVALETYKSEGKND